MWGWSQPDPGGSTVTGDCSPLALDEIWDDVISDLDSDCNAYAYVSSIGIGA
ncbi:hypothetical protein ACFQ7J_02140 [Streptomyces sp. NPDC056501]|uniref:hypothetical protein n=1 Tax=Streptomyces sp. NPDC056501 TaxID=3345841 RepID=UPI0036810A20